MSKNLQIERLNCYYNFLSRGEFKTRRREKESFGGEGAGLEPEPVIAGQGGRKRRKAMEMSATGRAGGEDGAGG